MIIVAVKRSNHTQSVTYKLHRQRSETIGSHTAEIVAVEGYFWVSYFRRKIWRHILAREPISYKGDKISHLYRLVLEIWRGKDRHRQTDDRRDDCFISVRA